MKKKTFINLIAICLFVGSCKPQELKDIPEKFDFSKFKNLEFNNELYSMIYFKEKDKRITIRLDKNYIIVEETNINNPYGITKTYSPKDYNILTICQTFYGKNIGILKRYEPNGQIIEVNLDKNYPFSIESLIKKLYDEYKIDVNNKEIQIGFDKSYINENGSGLYCYEIFIGQNGVYRKLTFNSSNGNLISDKEVHFEK